MTSILFVACSLICQQNWKVTPQSSGHDWPGFKKPPAPVTISESYVKLGFKSPSPKAHQQIVTDQENKFRGNVELAVKWIKSQRGRKFSEFKREDFLVLAIAIRFAGDGFYDRQYVSSFLTAWDKYSGSYSYQEYRWRTYVQASRFPSDRGIIALKKVYAYDPKAYDTRRWLIELMGVKESEQEFAGTLAERLVKDYPNFPGAYLTQARLNMSRTFSSRNLRWQKEARGQLEKGLSLAKTAGPFSYIKLIEEELKILRVRETKGYPEWREKR